MVPPRHSPKQATPCLPASPPDFSPGPTIPIFFSQKPSVVPQSLQWHSKSPTPRPPPPQSGLTWLQAAPHSPLSTAPSALCTHYSSPLPLCPALAHTWALLALPSCCVLSEQPPRLVPGAKGRPLQGSQGPTTRLSLLCPYDERP